MFQLTKLDRYIIKKFLGTFFYSLVIILSITIIFDFSEKIDDFIEESAPAREIIFNYYMNFVPYFGNLFSSLFVFITVIFFTAKMATNTEIIAILSSGVSFARMLRPYFLSAIVIAILSTLLGNYVIPPATEVRLEFEHKYLRSPYRRTEKDIHKQVEPNVFVYIQSYSSASDVAYRFSMEKFKDNKLQSKLISNYAKWDTAKQKWEVKDYYIREIDGLEEKITKGQSLDTAIHLYPADLKSRLDIIETMTLPELNEYIDKMRLQGSENISSYIFDKHIRFSYPFSILIMTLIGVSLSCRKMRGGMGMYIGLGLLLSFSYILFMRFSKMFALSGSIPPVLAVWLPNILYGIIGVVLYRFAPK
jgi:lipopolysaccharide export system permease protein